MIKGVIPLIKRIVAAVFCVCALTVTCFAAPTITQQPQDVYFPAGTTSGVVSFSVAAQGNGTLSYLWQISSNGGSSWTNTTNTSTIFNATTYQTPANFERDVNGGRLFRVVVTDDDGITVSESVTSRIAGFYLLGSMDQLLSFVSNVGGSILSTVADVAQTIVSTDLLVLSLGFFFLGGIISIIGRMLRKS